MNKINLFLFGISITFSGQIHGEAIQGKNPVAYEIAKTRPHRFDKIIRRLNHNSDKLVHKIFFKEKFLA